MNNIDVAVVIMILITIGFIFPVIGNHNYAAPLLKQEYPDCICPGDNITQTVNWSSVFSSYRCCECKARWYVWCVI